MKAPEWMPPARFIIFCAACLAIPLALAHFWTAASVAANAPVSSALAPIAPTPTSSPTTTAPLNFNVGPGSATTPTTVAPAAVTPTPASVTPPTPAPVTTVAPTPTTVPVAPQCTLVYQSSPHAGWATYALASNQPNTTAQYRISGGSTYSTIHYGSVQTDSAGAATVTENTGGNVGAPVFTEVGWKTDSAGNLIAACQATYVVPAQP